MYPALGIYGVCDLTTASLQVPNVVTLSVLVLMK